jgi:membrane protease YdiL (CAAX protease family)
VPICEEIMFRGTILYRFASYKALPTAIVSSAILFACLHPQNLLGTFAFAYIAAIAYIYSRSLFIPIGIHALNNSLGGYLSEVPYKSPLWTGSGSLEEWQNVPAQDFLICLVLLVIGGTIILRYIKAHPITADTKLPYFAALEESQSLTTSSATSSIVSS